MPNRIAARSTLAVLALLAFFSGARVHADRPLAVSGSYTLTQSMVDVDAAYLEWAAGRTLTSDDRLHLAALDVVRFRRDPAFVTGMIDGEQKNLPSFRSFDSQIQDDLRDTVLKDIPHYDANRLTPDEARQMQLILSGAQASAAGKSVAGSTDASAVPRSTPVVASSGIVSFPAERLPVHSGSYTLTQGMIDDTLGFWQIIAGRPFSLNDRQAMTAVDVDRFRHDPAFLTATLRQVHKNLSQIRHADAVAVAGLRSVNLVDIYCTPQALRLTPAEASGMQAVVSRYLPVVGVDTNRGMVITARDIDAWVAASNFFAKQAHVAGPGAGYRENLVKLSENPTTLGPLVETEVAGMDRNWTALELVWPHLAAAQRAGLVRVRLVKIKQAAAQGRQRTEEAVVALQTSQDAFEQDYPAALNPRLAQAKTMMQMRYGRFQQNMMNYNMQLLNRGVHNYQSQLNGQDPDMSDPVNNLQLPVP